MSRTPTSALRKEILAAFSGDGLLPLLTIAHADLAATRRFVRNEEDVVSNGDTFTAWGINVVLPADVDDRTPEVEFAVSLVMETLALELRDVSYPYPVVTLQLVKPSDPDTVEVELEFDAKVWPYDDLTLRLQCSYEPVLDEPWPAGQWLPSIAPEMF